MDRDVDAGGFSDDETRTSTRSADDGQSGPALDEIAPAQKLGRFVILSRAGVGAMGQVYAAYDPKLDRKIALKVILTKGSESQRAYLRREAKALAQLSHPNVVTVHEVDEWRGQLLVAMEYVDGKTLKQWLVSTPPDGTDGRTKKVLRLLLQAGAGLAEAHTRGLVHRDFKPANVIVGDDDRVRVVDFGLARALAPPEKKPDRETTETAQDHSFDSSDGERITRTGRTAGTPAYMAPEQFRGQATGATADQFAFAVVAWELLFGVRPFDRRELENRAHPFGSPPPKRPDDANVPQTIERSLAKALSFRPPARHKDMKALLLELESSLRIIEGLATPRSGRMRAVVPALVVALPVGAVLLTREWSEQAEETRCEEAAKQLPTDWAQSLRGNVQDGLARGGTPGSRESAERVVALLDAYADEWNEVALAACRSANVDETWDEATTRKAQWCLERRSSEFTALATELTEPARASLHRATPAAARLRSPGPCSDLRALATAPAPPDNPASHDVLASFELLSKANAMQQLHRFDDGLSLVEEMRENNVPGLESSILNIEANLLRGSGRYEDAATSAKQAYVSAASSGDWDIAADSAISLIELVGVRLLRFPEGKEWSLHAVVAIANSGDASELREARRLSNLGSIAYRQADHHKALEYYTDALELWTHALGPEHPIIAGAAMNIANVQSMLGASKEARIRYEQALQVSTKTLGPENLQTAWIATNVGSFLSTDGDKNSAQTILTKALNVRTRELGDNHILVAETRRSLGDHYGRIGRLDESEKQLLAALKIIEEQPGKRARDMSNVLNSLVATLIDARRYDEALLYAERAASIATESLGLEHQDTAVVLHNLASVHSARGDHEAAARTFSSAIEIYQRVLGEATPHTALAMTDLAQARLAQGDTAEALRVATRALALADEVFGQGTKEWILALSVSAKVHEATGALDTSESLLQSGLSAGTAALGEGHPLVGDLRVQRGVVLAKSGLTQDALASIEEGVKILVESKAESGLLAEARFALAQVVLDASSDDALARDRAWSLAEASLDDFEAAGRTSDVEKVRHWLENARE
jgi:serine/threonine-protein kinase